MRSILLTPPSPVGMEAAKAFYGLLSGLSKRQYFADDTITDEFLQEELFADAADGASRISALAPHLTAIEIHLPRAAPPHLRASCHWPCILLIRCTS